MHERSISESLLSMVLKRSKSPKKVFVELGALTTFKPDPIHFYFDQFKKAHVNLQTTELHIEEVEGILLCNECKKESKVLDQTLLFCPLCESFDTEVVQGKDFILKEIIE